MCETAPAAWTPCSNCEEFICNIHDVHVSDCICPDIDTWVIADLFPYDAKVTDELRAWVKANPFNEDEE